VDGAAIAEQASAETRPEGSVRLVFSWRLQEPGARFTGDGVIRMEEPYRARLDLFTDRGEGAAIAALVEDELRLPPGAMDIPLPPPPLFWATAGVFRPGTGSELLSATAREGGALLRYRLPDGRHLHFLMTGSRIDRVELRVDDSVEEEVRLEWNRDGRVPSSARYRLMRETRELSTTLEQIDDVDAFPPDIWTPDA
jgi:hypothetical protein